MGYKALEFNGIRVLAYTDEETNYQIQEEDIIYCMQLNIYFQITNKKLDLIQLRDEGFKKIQNTMLKHAGVSKFTREDEELYIERKSHLLLKIVTP